MFAVYSQFVVPQDEGFSVALPSKVSESPPHPPPPSISINDVTLLAALKWNFAILEVKTDLTM